jgi:ArsR family transcriptional regulator, arsenate/arsenite/antimonite-responsive transcriptional repressor
MAGCVGSRLQCRNEESQMKDFAPVPARPPESLASLKVFQSLSSPLRLDLFCVLVRAGQDGMVAGELAESLAVGATNLSFHLKAMRAAGLVTVQSQGRYQRYRANVGHMLRVLAFLTENCAAGDA